MFQTLLTDESPNSVDPDKIAPIGTVWSGSTLLAKEAYKTFQQMTKQMTFIVI